MHVNEAVRQALQVVGLVLVVALLALLRCHIVALFRHERLHTKNQDVVLLHTVKQIYDTEYTSGYVEELRSNSTHHSNGRTKVRGL